MSYLHSPFTAPFQSQDKCLTSFSATTPPIPPTQAGTTDLYLILAEERWGSRSPEQLAEAILVVLLEKASLEGPQPISIIHLERTVGSIMQNVQGHHDTFTLSSQSTNLYSAHCKHKTCTWLRSSSSREGDEQTHNDLRIPCQ